MSGPLFPFGGANLLGYGQLTSLGPAVLLSTIVVNGVTGIPVGSTYALMQAEGANIRWRDDGVPTAAFGMRLISGNDPLGFTGPEFSFLQFIQEAATAKLNVAFYKGR